MTQPQHNESLGPPNRDAEILQFKVREGEAIDPRDLSPAECVSFYLHKWNHPSFQNRPIAPVVNADTPVSIEDDEWQARLDEIVRDSPFLDYYDELLEDDPVTLLLDSTVRSTKEDGSMTEERKALRKLMEIRAAEVIEDTKVDIRSQLARIPLGTEELWVPLIKRLAEQR